VQNSENSELPDPSKYRKQCHSFQILQNTESSELSNPSKYRKQ